MENRALTERAVELRRRFTLAARVASGQMPKRVSDETRLSVRLEIVMTAGLRAAIADAAARAGAISEGEWLRQVLAREVQRAGVRIRRLPSPPTRPARGKRRKAARPPERG